VINKHISNRFFLIFENKDIETLSIVSINLDKILISQEANNNEEFFTQFTSNFYKIEECLNEVKDWRILLNIVTAMDE
jgi:hypothetical protein